MISSARLKSASFKELTELAGKIRQFLIDSIAATGGHIGANLATIELSLALHRVFESPEEKIIWDTGHQGYTHKIVTGRQDGFAAGSGTAVVVTGFEGDDGSGAARIVLPVRGFENS